MYIFIGMIMIIILPDLVIIIFTSHHRLHQIIRMTARKTFLCMHALLLEAYKNFPVGDPTVCGPYFFSPPKKIPHSFLFGISQEEEYNIDQYFCFVVVLSSALLFCLTGYWGWEDEEMFALYFWNIYFFVGRIEAHKLTTISNVKRENVPLRIKIIFKVESRESSYGSRQ